MKINLRTSLRCILLAAAMSAAHSAPAFYDPKVGRWLTRDPIGDVGILGRSKDALSPPSVEETMRAEANLYCFVRNRPTVAFDALGLIDFVYWPPQISGNCNKKEIRACQEACFAKGLVLKQCTAHSGSYVVEQWSNGVEYYQKRIYWRQAFCDCIEPRKCPPPGPGLGNGRNDPPQ